MKGPQLNKIEASEAYFIKLGRGGEWESECLANGTLRFGYHKTPHELCLAGKWDDVRRFWEKERGHAGTATNDERQIRTFYEAGAEAIFITFCHGRLYWCRPAASIKRLPCGGKVRPTLEGWRDYSLNGTILTSDKLSGHLLKVQMYRGTICEVVARDYLLRKLNDEVLPEVQAAEVAQQAHRTALVELMRLLTWQDFEILVDLVFSASGWRRIGVVGKTQKTVDLELLLPTTGERAFVQVKARADHAALGDYADRFAASGYDRMFLVWHSGRLDEAAAPDRVNLVGPERLASMVLDAGLSSWLREKAS
jgi:hypothetical protein